MKRFDDHRSVVRLSPVSRVTPPPTSLVRKQMPRRQEFLLGERAAISCESASTTRMRTNKSIARRALASFSLRSRYHHALGTMFGASFAAHLAGKIAAILLLPLLIIHPILPVFAADESVAVTETPPQVLTVDEPTLDLETPVATDPAENVSTEFSGSTLPDADTSSDAMAGDTGESNEDMAAVAPPADDTPEATNADSGEQDADNGVEAVSEAATSSETTSVESGDMVSGTTEDDEVQGIGTVAGEATTTSTSETPGGGSVAEEATSTPTGGVVDSAELSLESGEDAIATAIATDTAVDIATTTTEAVPEPTVEELVAAELKSREEGIRAAVRAEVEESFTRGCVQMDATGYYCLKNNGENGTQTHDADLRVSAVSARSDEGQDKEIYMTKGGEDIAVTANSYDDAFPAKDVTGSALVWQANIDGRWQIFVADVATKTPVITQLTHGWESNFNPKIDGGRIVWQGWADGNWEIFLAERFPAGAELSVNDLPAQNKKLGIDGAWKVTRITSDDAHDMFPSIAGNIISWQKNEGGSWAVFVYELATGESARVSGDGVKGEMPRFAMVWAERNPDGSQKLISYDLAKGEKTNLTSEAQQAAYQEQPYKSEVPLPPPPPPPAPEPMAIPSSATSSTSTTTKLDGGDGGDDDTAMVPEFEPEVAATSSDVVIDLSATTTVEVGEITE